MGREREGMAHAFDYSLVLHVWVFSFCPFSTFVVALGGSFLSALLLDSPFLFFHPPYHTQSLSHHSTLLWTTRTSLSIRNLPDLPSWTKESVFFSVDVCTFGQAKWDRFSRLTVKVCFSLFCFSPSLYCVITWNNPWWLQWIVWVHRSKSNNGVSLASRIRYLDRIVLESFDVFFVERAN